MLLITAVASQGRPGRSSTFQGFNGLTHPSGSPGLDPSEMLWTDLKQMVRAKRPAATSLDGLWEQITTAYEQMLQS